MVQAETNASAVYDPKEVFWKQPDACFLADYLKSRSFHDSDRGITLHPLRTFQNIIDNYRRWFSNPEVLRYLHPSTPFTDNPEQRVTPEEFVRYMDRDMRFIYYLIFLDKRRGAIGHVSVNGINYTERSFSLGYVIGETEFWNQGIASSAAKLLINSMAEVEFRRATATAHKDNTASIRILNKLLNNGVKQGELVAYETDLLT